MKPIDHRRLGWFLGAALVIALVGELIFYALFSLADAEIWYRENLWLKQLILLPAYALAYQRSGVELVGLRRRLGLKP